jgi:hypothetical protein
MTKFNKICAALVAVLLAVDGYLIVTTAILKYRSRPPTRPEICDRTGKVLLTDRRKSFFAMPVRHAECGGKFASALLGHTIISYGTRKGALGVESLIDRNGITSPRVYLTMDAGIQEKCETLLDRIVEIRAPHYTYITILDSDGNLIAAAQRPAMDLNDRSIVGYQELIFMAPGYVFPVSNAWMQLLGSSSFAEPEEKMRFRFHEKTGVFPVESCGIIPGIKHPEWDHADSQSATVPGYLLAFIGVTEEKEIPKLKVFLPDGVPCPAKKIAGNPHWISLLWSQDRSTLSALGMIPSDSGTALYTLLRVAYPKDDPENEQEDYCELLEKEVHAFARYAPQQTE